MSRSRQKREFSIRFDDGFRGGIALLVSLPVLVLIPLLGDSRRGLSAIDPALIFLVMCPAFTVFFVVFLIWTHRVYSRADLEELMRISALQHRRGASGFSRLIGLKSAEDWAMTSALTALLISVAAAVISAQARLIWLPLLVLLTVAAAWTTVVYAFALRYLRLHAAGETIEFDIEESPQFADFLSMSVMVSSVGAMSAGTPRTRVGLTTVRTHTFIAFAFNALVVAMAVSLITTLITG